MQTGMAAPAHEVSLQRRGGGDRPGSPRSPPHSGGFAPAVTRPSPRYGAFTDLSGLGGQPGPSPAPLGPLSGRPGHPGRPGSSPANPVVLSSPPGSPSHAPPEQPGWPEYNHQPTHVVTRPEPRRGGYTDPSGLTVPVRRPKASRGGFTDMSALGFRPPSPGRAP